MNGKRKMSLEEFAAIPVDQVPVRKKAKNRQNGEWYYVDESSPKPSKTGGDWLRYNYEKQLELAKSSRKMVARPILSFFASDVAVGFMGL